MRVPDSIGGSQEATWRVLSMAHGRGIDPRPKNLCCLLFKKGHEKECAGGEPRETIWTEEG
jgi:hypothetical protein